MNMIKRLFTPTHLAIVNNELDAARLQLLSAENDLEHVQAQVNLLNTRIARLENKVKSVDAYTSSMLDAQIYATRLRSTSADSIGRSQSEHDISELRPKIAGK